MELLNPAVVKPYEPRHFGRDYCRLSTSGQYPMFVAAALGIKPVFDDWIEVSKFGKYVDVCRKYSLFVEPDVVFVKNSNGNGAMGRENITTTHHAARRFSQDIKEGDVHVFVSRSKENLTEAKKFGWYPVFINGRSVNKPFIDHLRFGKILGYPGCCIDFFSRYNDWNRYSHPFEAFKNSRDFSRYCNNFLMDASYSFIHHLPCSYDCPNTIELAGKVEKAMEEVEPGFAENMAEMLKKPLLVLNEKNFIIFDGELKESSGIKTIHYSNCQYFHNPSRPHEKIGFFGDVLKGNTIEIGRTGILIGENGSEVSQIKKNPRWFAAKFR